MPSNVTLKSIVCDSTGNTVTAKMTFDMSTQSYDAQKMADHVYVRTYEGKVQDVIIVKGADISVSAN